MLNVSAYVYVNESLCQDSRSEYYKTVEYIVIILEGESTCKNIVAYL